MLAIKSGATTPFYYTHNGIKQAYIRIGNESIVAPNHILNELILKGSNQTYDSILTEYQKFNYSFTLLEATYFAKTNIHLEKSDYISFGLTNVDGILTRAGALLTDQPILRHSRLFCTRWNGLEKGSIFDDALDDKEFSGSLIYLLNSGIDFIKNNSKVRFSKESTYRLDKPDYAERAIQECLVNALIHRDYLILGSEVHIDMYDDRVEITSPGGMYDRGLIQFLNIDHIASSRRNPVIADLFHRMKYMERRGSGLKKIIAETENLPGYTEKLKPIFDSSHSFFRVIIKNVNFNPQVNPQVVHKIKDIQSIIEFCKTAKSNKEIMSFCGFKDAKYFKKQFLTPLIEQGKLTMTIPDKPTSRNQKYIKK